MWEYKTITESDVLMHSNGHKYIDRKMGKNGKYIYTYADDLVGAANKAKQAKQQQRQAEWGRQADEAERARKSNTEKNTKSLSEWGKGVKMSYNRKDMSSLDAAAIANKIYNSSNDFDVANIDRIVIKKVSDETYDLKGNPIKTPTYKATVQYKTDDSKKKGYKSGIEFNKEDLNKYVAESLTPKKATKYER